MSKQSLLLVDGDTRSLRVLEVSLRKAGFTVTTSESVQDAIDKLEVHAPDLIVSETIFPDGDGFELRRRVRATPDWAEIPFIFLTAELAIENKIRGLELGVDDYLTKPIYIKEIITRINILLQKRQRARFEERRDGRTRFAGRVADMPVVDVIQTIEISRKSGVIQFLGERNKQATIYFRDGRVIDAEAGSLQGEDAVYRLLTWNDGEFEVVFRTVRRREVIQTSSQGLLMEGMRRLDEWSRILEQLPPLSHRFEIDTAELATRLGEIPDDNNRILRLIDGRRSLIEVIDASDVGDLECLQAIARLYFEEILLDLDHGQGERKRDTGRQPAVAPTPIEDAASGPLRISGPTILEGTPPRSAPIPAPQPATETIPTDLADVIEEQTAPITIDADDVGPPGDDAELTPLLGGYRASSLRKIDEAVEAAQAFEPSLLATFDDPPRPAPRAPDDAIPTAIPTTIEHETSAPQPRAVQVARAATLRELPAVPPLPALARDDSGLRMIGSLGRDRAEASGELRPPPGLLPAPTTTEPARELVTIQPRRKTSEIPILKSDPKPVEAKPEAPPPPVAPAVEEAPEAPTTVEPIPAVAAIEPPAPPVRPSTPPRALSSERDPLATTHRVRPRPFSPEELAPRPTPPAPRRIGVGTIAAVAAAAVLAVVAVKVKAREPAPTGPSGRPLAIPTPAVDAGEPTPTPDAAEPTPPPDAMTAAAPIDAPALAAVDAAPSAPADAALDPMKEAKQLYEQAFAAIEEQDYAKALTLADQSLRLRKTARTYLVKATALQRLGKVDDAVDAIDLAIDIFRRNGTDSGAAWAQKGRILWAAGRKDEARVAFTHYLALDPNSPDAAAIHKMIGDGP